MKEFPTAPRWFANVLKAENFLLKKFKNHLPTQAELHNDDQDTNDFSYNEDLDLLAAERMVPGKNYSPYMVQHVARYLWAMSFCRGKTVVDLGCGDGYGTYMLSWVAESATGVDISPKAIQESIRTYGSAESYAALNTEEQARIETDFSELPSNPWAPIYKIADLTEPQTLPDAEFGVCFEVLEHLDNPQEILKSIAESNIETVFFSVPNPLAGGSHINPHHVNDWSLGMLKGYFRDAGAKEIKTYRQGLKRYQIKRGATYADLNWLFKVRFK